MTCPGQWEKERKGEQKEEPKRMQEGREQVCHLQDTRMCEA